MLQRIYLLQRDIIKSKNKILPLGVARILISHVFKKCCQFTVKYNDTAFYKLILNNLKLILIDKIV